AGGAAGPSGIGAAGAPVPPPWRTVGWGLAAPATGSPPAVTAPVFWIVTTYSTTAPGMALGLVVPLNGSLTTDEVFEIASAADCTKYWSSAVSVASRAASANTMSTLPAVSAPAVCVSSVAPLVPGTAARACRRTFATCALVAPAGMLTTTNTVTLASFAKVLMLVAVSVPAW